MLSEAEIEERLSQYDSVRKRVNGVLEGEPAINGIAIAVDILEVNVPNLAEEWERKMVYAELLSLIHKIIPEHTPSDGPLH